MLSEFILKKVVLLPLFLALAGCSVEQNYRGVPEPLWQYLTGEQKQLIVDQSFHDEMKKDELGS